MEKLYNNIILEDGFTNEPANAENVPYLKNPPEVIDVTVGRQLFADDFLIDKTDLSPEYHKAKKFEGNPILKPETEWECFGSPVACPKSGGVFYDEDEKIFKMWYEAGWLYQMCYATSKDGIHWERPDLDVEPGTNKILTYEGWELKKEHTDDVMYLRPDSTTVFIDPHAPKDEKYKLFLRNPGNDYPGIAAVSADGIHFRDFKFTGKVYDRSSIFYNPFRKKWCFSIRWSWWKPEIPRLHRVRYYKEVDNYMEECAWADGEATPWMTEDDLDKPKADIGFKPMPYNIDCVAYESIMVGMMQMLFGPENEISEKSGTPKLTELIPMYSRDGYHFSRPCRDSIIEATRTKDSWERGYVQCVSGGIIPNGDELWIYYIGFKGDENYANQSWFTNGMYRYGSTGLAKLRRDGFVSMNGCGTLTTRKLTTNGKASLHINAIGKVAAHVLDKDGNILATSAEFEGDSTNTKLDFGGFDISSLNGKVFRLKFDVDGKLYSFGFADKNGDFGGENGAGTVK